MGNLAAGTRPVRCSTSGQTGQGTCSKSFRDDRPEIVIQAMRMRAKYEPFFRGEGTVVPDKKSHGRSKAGVELTDEALAQMAKEAQEGLDITKLRRRPGWPSMDSGPAESLPVRLDPELRLALDDRAAADDTTASDVVREALRRYLKLS